MGAASRDSCADTELDRPNKILTRDGTKLKRARGSGTNLVEMLILHQSDVILATSL